MVTENILTKEEEHLFDEVFNLFWQRTMSPELHTKYSIVYKTECCKMRDEIIENLQIVGILTGMATVEDVAKYLVIEFYKTFENLNLTAVPEKTFYNLCKEFLNFYREDIRDVG